MIRLRETPERIMPAPKELLVSLKKDLKPKCYHYDLLNKQNILFSHYLSWLLPPHSIGEGRIPALGYGDDYTYDITSRQMTLASP